MEFEFTGIIYIYPEDLEEMYLRVKNGEDFVKVYYDILSGYEDGDYAYAGCIIHQVEAEITRRLVQEGKEE